MNKITRTVLRTINNNALRVIGVWITYKYYNIMNDTYLLSEFQHGGGPNKLCLKKKKLPQKMWKKPTLLLLLFSRFDEKHNNSKVAMLYADRFTDLTLVNDTISSVVYSAVAVVDLTRTIIMYTEENINGFNR